MSTTTTENKFIKLPIIKQLVYLLQKIKLPWLHGLSLFDLLDLYFVGTCFYIHCHSRASAELLQLIQMWIPTSEVETSFALLNKDVSSSLPVSSPGRPCVGGRRGGLAVSLVPGARCPLLPRREALIPRCPGGL